MAPYNFWQDLLDTYQSLPDWLKLAWLVVPQVSLVAVVALVLRYRVDVRRLGVSGRVVEGPDLARRENGPKDVAGGWPGDAAGRRLTGYPSTPELMRLPEPRLSRDGG